MVLWSIFAYGHNKMKPLRSPKYMQFIRTRPCCVTGNTDNIVAHHVRVLRGGQGLAIKPTDYFCVPIEATEHVRLHSIGEKTFWSEYSIDPKELIYLNLNIYLASYTSQGLVDLEPLINFIHVFCD